MPTYLQGPTRPLACSAAGIGGLPREVAIDGGPPNSERSGQLAHRFTGGGEPPQLLLPGLGFGGLVTGRRRARRNSRDAARRSRPKLQFQLRQGGHHRRHRLPRRGGRVHAFAHGAQRNTAPTRVSNGTGDLGNGAAQPIDRRHHHGVVAAGIVKQRPTPAGQSPPTRDSLSVNTRPRSTPAAPSATSWTSRSWPTVLTLAYPSLAVTDTRLTPTNHPRSETRRHATTNETPRL
jgi:hypothetical protein